MSRRFLSTLASAITISILLSIASPLTRAVSASPAEGVAPHRDQYPKFADFVPELIDRMTKDGGPQTDLANKVLRQVRFWFTFAWGIVGLKWLLVAILAVAILRRMNRVRKESSRPKAQ
ncbi:MAG: hypothetical protein ACM3WU_10885 [Bacillota bacterium]